MVRARFSGTNHYHDGEPLSKGDVVELTEEQYEQWSRQFELLDEGTESDAAEPEGTPDETGDTQDDEDEESESEPAGESEDTLEDVLEKSVDELESRLASGEYDDRLDELEITERSKENPRTTALTAIEDRKDQV